MPWNGTEFDLIDGAFLSGHLWYANEAMYAKRAGFCPLCQLRQWSTPTISFLLIHFRWFDGNVRWHEGEERNLPPKKEKKKAIDDVT